MHYINVIVYVAIATYIWLYLKGGGRYSCSSYWGAKEILCGVTKFKNSVAVKGRESGSILPGIDSVGSNLGLGD